MAKNQSKPDGDIFVDFGATGLRQYSGYVREEFLPALTGWTASKMYREMRDNDAIVGAMMFAIMMLLRDVPMYVEPQEKKNPDDLEAADFVNSCFTDMDQTWPELISEILTFLTYGFHVAEICYKIRGGESDDLRLDSQYDDGMIGWRKFMGLAQETTLRWDFDKGGTPLTMVQLLPTGGPILTVPLSKCLHFRTQLLKNNPEGVSILRNAYVSYTYKKRLMEIEAIGIQRELCGLPIARVPAQILSVNASQADIAQRNAIKAILLSVSKNEQGALLFPLVYDKDGHELYKFELLSTGGRRQIDIGPVIERYNHNIASTTLADFIMLGSGGSSGKGSFALSKNKTDMFSTATTGFLNLITGEFSRKAIPDLLSLNRMAGKVVMRHGDIARRDLSDLGTFMKSVENFVTPNPILESHLLEEAGMPAPDDTGDIGEGSASSETSDTTQDPGDDVQKAKRQSRARATRRKRAK